MTNKNIYLKLLILLIVSVPTTLFAQLSSQQQQTIKEKTTQYCRLLERMVSEPNDAETLETLVSLFNDPTNNLVYNDLIPGENRIPFMEYVTVIRSLGGTTTFHFGAPALYYQEFNGYLFGMGKVEKQITDGFGNTRRVENVIILNLSDGKLGDVGARLPALAKKPNERTPINSYKNDSNNTTAQQSGDVEKDLPWLEMVFVEGGTFKMGSNDGKSSEKPIHEVQVDDFYIGKYEVTQAQWKQIMGTNPSYFKDCPECPVVSVNWNDIHEFLKKLNEQTGQTYRLPTEAEWEYAARGGSKSKGYKYSGSNNLDELAWYDKNSDKKTHPVGQKKANELGLFDMSGNVWEWCSDWYGNDYYAKSPKDNPQGPESGERHVLRGGSWDININYCHVTYRYRLFPFYRFNYIGFRLVRDS